jgi:phytanoyl-CoA hydroxylase
MTAAWVALEDIDPAATRFFIVPGSQDFDGEFSEEEIWGPEKHYTTRMSKILKERYDNQVTIPEMKAGDVLFWNSRTIHGSLEGSDPTKSRLSLTAHYIPNGFGFGKRNQKNILGEAAKMVDGHPIPYNQPWNPANSRKAQLLKKFGLY